MSLVHARVCMDTTRSQRKGVMAMIDLKVLNQSLSSMYSKLSPGCRSNSLGLNLRRALVGLFALVLIVCPQITRAQELSATLSGQVSDATGAVIAHAAVTITLN